MNHLPAPEPRRCAHCGDEFLTIHPARRYCSVRCGKQLPPPTPSPTTR